MTVGNIKKLYYCNNNNNNAYLKSITSIGMHLKILKI